MFGYPVHRRLILHYNHQRESTAVFDDPKGKAPVNGVHTMEKSEVNQASTLAVFECRGCEFTEFEPRVSIQFPMLR